MNFSQNCTLKNVLDFLKDPIGTLVSFPFFWQVLWPDNFLQRGFTLDRPLKEPQFFHEFEPFPSLYIGINSNANKARDRQISVF